MKRNTFTNRKALTLVELMVTMAIALIVILSVGLVLVDSQKGWNRMYDRVYGDIVTDGYVARKTFDAVVRKSSIKRADFVSSNDFYAYYYQDQASTKLDRYARFYTRENQLLVDYGQLDDSENRLNAYSTVVLARNVKTAYFANPPGTSIQMIIELDDGRLAMTVTCTANRHNE